MPAHGAARPGGIRKHRFRLTHGPIDVIVDLDGEARAVARAEALAFAAFDGLLESLVAELAVLRAPARRDGPDPSGQVARRMAAAVRPFSHWFITPMAAVAGAVADHILAAFRDLPGLERAVVNNGGDIALHLAARARYRVGISDLSAAAFAGIAEIADDSGIGGVATSGWQGRSHSLGIADAVTVLAVSAAEADAAATMIANAVDLPGSAAILRRPARELSPDSDLGARLVTVGVGALTETEKTRGLQAGVERAEEIVTMGAARAVFLVLQGRSRVVGAEHLSVPSG
ncbi:MAG: UPF0280 family protein [Paracoccaceae bacterium]